MAKLFTFNKDPDTEFMLERLKEVTKCNATTIVKGLVRWYYQKRVIEHEKMHNPPEDFVRDHGKVLPEEQAISQ